MQQDDVQFQMQDYATDKQIQNIKKDEQDKDQNKYNQNILVCSLCCYLTIIVTIQIVLAAIIVKLFNDGSNSFDGIVDNWNEEVVTDFYIPKNDGSCESNDSSVFSYYWPGTHQGCLCTVGNYFLQGACCNSVSGVLINNDNCCYGKGFDENKPKTFDLWGSGAHQEVPIRLCAKRLDGYNFRLKSPRSFSCKDNEQMCGGKDEENQNYMFCVPKESKCPIQEIYLQQNSQGTLESALIQQGSISIQIFVLRNSPKLLPLSQFKVSNALEACADEDEAYIPERVDSLDRRNNLCYRQESQYEDTQFEIDQARYFLAQGINVSDDKTVRTNKYNFHLLQNNYVDMQMSCRDQIEKFYDNNDILQKLQKLCIALLVLVAINDFMLVMFNVLRQTMQKCYKFMLISYIVRQIIVLICIIFCAYIASVYISQYDFLNKYQEKKCFDKDYDNLIDNIKKKLNSGCVIGLILLLVIQLCTDPDFITYLLKRFDKLKNAYLEKFFLFCGADN